MLKVYNVKSKFKCFFQIQSIKTITTFFGNKFKPPNSPMRREWKSKSPQIEAKKNYKLLSYNILAQDLLVEHLHLYYNIQNELLRWENRLNKIVEEISNVNPDIICLQEMQYDHLKQLVKQIGSVRQKRKWEYIFKKKTGTRSDGCVIIYDKMLLKLVSEQNVEYYTIGVPTLNRENIAVMAKFQELENSNSFVVATTHLLYNPRREDVRISQVNKLIQAIANFSRPDQVVDGNNSLPTILTGDFNFTPDTRAFEILTALRKGEVSPYYGEPYFQLDAIDFGRENTASTFQDKWVTVDYILTSRTPRDKKSIKVVNVYQLPLIAECLKTGKIPNKFVGSDHFMLAIHFTIC